jgi:hypothetical protein
MGSVWTVPPAHTVPFPVPFSLEISGGSLGSNLSYVVAWQSNNTLRTVSPLPSLFTNSLSGSLIPKTGLFTITFGNENHKGTTTGTGVLLQGVPSGGGYFLGVTNAGSINLQVPLSGGGILIPNSLR